MILPTRPDGGIDWEKIKLDRTIGHPFVSGGPSWGTIEFAIKTAAHTRERCAKWHRKKSRIARSCCVEVGKRGDEARSAMKLHDESAAAIEEMED